MLVETMPPAPVPSRTNSLEHGRATGRTRRWQTNPCGYQRRCCGDSWRTWTLSMQAPTPSCSKDVVWRSIAKSPKTFWPTCTVSQQLGVPECKDSEHHLQEFSRAASGNGVRHRCRAMLLILNICTAPTPSPAACMKISVVSNRAHEKRTFALILRVRSSLHLFSQ